MGTHISKVKSVDLDVWTAEQMESIQKWGNHLANLYWEAHLKPGHIPPEHKIESFVRSKYESRRWAMEGPLPTDPSVLEKSVNETLNPLSNPTSASLPPAPLLSNSSVTSSTAQRGIGTTRAPEVHQLLSSHHSNQRAHTLAERNDHISTVDPRTSFAPPDDLFSLDFNNSTAPSPPVVVPHNEIVTSKKDVKNDILSLFSSSTPAAAPVWNNTNPQPSQPTSMIGTQGVSMWGANSGWNDPSSQQASTQPTVWQSNAASMTSNTANIGLFAGPNVWDVHNSTVPPKPSTNADPFSSGAPKHDDAFGDIWNRFK
jgi:stromal membrane-associated protein